MATIKLCYFKVKGRGQAYSRLLLAASGLPWEDGGFTRDQWPLYQADAPFGQAPYLVYNGQKYGQSVAIATFLAREFGFAGRTNLEALRIDEVVQLLQDFINCWIRLFNEKDESKKPELESKLKTEDIPRFFSFFQTLLQKSGTGFFVGDQLTLADIAVYDTVCNFEYLMNVDITRDYPAISSLRLRVESHPKLKDYLDKEKQEQAKFS